MAQEFRRSFPAHLPWPAIALALVIIGIQLAGEPANRLLRYEREAVLAGELWRLLSAHLVHLGWTHLLLNLVGLGILVGGFGAGFAHRPGRLGLAFLILSLGTSGGLLVFDKQLEWYVGLSGVLHGLALLLAVRLWQRERTASTILIGGLILKVGWEQLVGGTGDLAEAIGGAVVVNAHLYGLVVGVIFSAAAVAAKTIGAKKPA